MTDTQASNTFGKESGHWYDRTGTLVETVPYADPRKGHRQTTLRDARKRGDLAPGVTTIIGMANKPQLVTWKMKQAALAALTCPRQPDENEDAWLARVLEVDANEHARDAADEGTRIHAAIEQHFRRETYDDSYRPHVEGVLGCLELLGPQEWQPEKGAAHPFGFGTKADLHSDEWVVDFKGKDGDDEALARLTTWDDHHMQLAATRQAMGVPGARAAICYVSRTHPGAAALFEVTQAQLTKGWECFRCLLAFWQAKNNYRPNWAVQVTL